MPLFLPFDRSASAFAVVELRSEQGTGVLLLISRMTVAEKLSTVQVGKNVSRETSYQDSNVADVSRETSGHQRPVSS